MSRRDLHRLTPAPVVVDQERDHPLDALNCQGRFQRLVVACMNHCPYGDNYCKSFRDFFTDRRLTPVQYHNKNNVGETVMRRVVFDCDRCNKRDVPEVYCRYVNGFVADDNLMGTEALCEMFRSHGYEFDGVGEATIFILELMERQHGWVHLCGPCFKKSLSALGGLLKIKPFILAEEPVEPDFAEVDAPQKAVSREVKGDSAPSSKKKRPRSNRSRAAAN